MPVEKEIAKGVGHSHSSVGPLHSNGFNKRIEIGDRDTFVNAVSDKATDVFANRDERKAFFARLGIDKMKENDRIVFFRDETQLLLFRGTLDDKGNVILKESMDLTPPKDTKNFTPYLAEMIKIIKDNKLEFKSMKQSITVPKERNEDSDKKLRSEITLFALADRAMSNTQVVSASNAALPYSGTDNKVQI